MRSARPIWIKTTDFCLPVLIIKVPTKLHNNATVKSQNHTTQTDHLHYLLPGNLLRYLYTYSNHNLPKCVLVQKANLFNMRTDGWTQWIQRKRFQFHWFGGNFPSTCTVSRWSVTTKPNTPTNRKHNGQTFQSNGGNDQAYRCLLTNPASFILSKSTYFSSEFIKKNVYEFSILYKGNKIFEQRKTNQIKCLIQFLAFCLAYLPLYNVFRFLGSFWVPVSSPSPSFCKPFWFCPQYSILIFVNTWSQLLQQASMSSFHQ